MRNEENKDSAMNINESIRTQRTHDGTTRETNEDTTQSETRGTMREH